MLKPARLNSGDTVALVNPVGMPPERFRHYIPLMEEYLKAEGFKIKTYYAPENAGQQELAGVFISAWIDPEVKAVFPICGGFSIYEVVKHLDAEAMRSHPVLVVGSSLLSVLSIWITQRADMLTFFGPHIPFLHTRSPQRENEFTIQSFWDMVMWKIGRTKRIATVHERHHYFRVNSEADSVLVTNIYKRSDLITDPRRRDVSFVSAHKGKICGKTAFITLGSLLEMVRRDMLLPLEGCVLFTETMDWRFEEVRAALKEILSHPSLRGLRGVFITALTERTDRIEKLFEELNDQKQILDLCEYTSDLANTPAIYGFPLGHCAYKLTLPQLIECEVDLEEGTLLLKERPVL